MASPFKQIFTDVLMTALFAATEWLSRLGNFDEFVEANIAAGVKMYEYKPGFIHSKTFLSDDKIATVGTVNLDFRSLYLHYECGCVLYKKDGIADIRRDFKETFEKCIAVDKDYYETIPLWQRAAGRLLRIFGPIL